MNQVISEARVYTPDDTTVQTPNSDTPYSFFGADLRTEPLVITVPEIDPKRYYSIQFVDAYTFNFHYVGSRTTGNGAGTFLLAGPGWKGEKPDGIKEVITSETGLVLAIYRTQLLGPDDIDNVKEIQAGYKLEPLSEYPGDRGGIGRSHPQLRGAAVEGGAEDLTRGVRDPELHPDGVLPDGSVGGSSDDALGKDQCGAGQDLRSERVLAGMLQQAIKDGIADAWQEFNQFKKDKLDTGEVTSGELFGTRESPQEQLPLPHGRRRYGYLWQLRRGGVVPAVIRWTQTATSWTGATATPCDSLLERARRSMLSRRSPCISCRNRSVGEPH